MKKDLLEFLNSLLKNKSNNISDVGIHQIDLNPEPLSKEQKVNEMLSYIKMHLEINSMILCSVTESEWRIFLEVSYDQFLANGMDAGYINFMQMSIDYLLAGQYPHDASGITFQNIIENFNMDFLPPGVAEVMVQNIRKSVYLVTRKDNIINFLEYKNISRR